MQRFSRTIRKWIYLVLLTKPFNTLGRVLFSALPVSLRANSRYVFPVRGSLKIRYGRYGSFTMMNDGHDTICSRAFFADAFINDPAAAQALTAFFLRGTCFFDVGANSGLYTLMAAKHSNIEEIHAFEPVPKVYDYLSRNIAANNDRSKAHQAAVSSRVGKLRMRIPLTIMLPVGSSAAGSKKRFDDSDYWDFEVPSTTIDEFTKSVASLPPDVIKIDTETTEAEVLKGTVETTKKHRPSFIIEVITEEVATAVEQFFKDLGFSYFHLNGTWEKTKRISPHLDFMNYAIVPNEKVDQFIIDVKNI